MLNAMDLYKGLYPGCFSGIMPAVLTGLTLKEVRLRPWFSDIAPHDVDLTTKIGPVTLPLPIFSAAMDTVSGPDLAKALSDVGGCCIIYRHKKEEVQLAWIKEALSYKPCLITKPESLNPDNTIADVEDILKNQGFSTIPVVTKKGILKGIIFTRDIAFKDHYDEPVKDWMIPVSKLKQVGPDVSFEKVRDRLLNEQNCSVLPVVDKNGRMLGMYFMKDFLQINPASHNGKPLVGMAVGVSSSDLKRVKDALDLGVGVVVIDSSHGNSKAVIEQAKKIVKLVDGRAAVIAGNVASIDGYLNLAAAGVSAVKCGIGSGSICTTSNVTGAGVPMFTLIRELSYARRVLLEKGMHAPAIIPDGSINGPGDFNIAMAAGGHACMAGKWLVAAEESISAQKSNRKKGELTSYRGMASPGAIGDRSSDRYGKQKKAAEGVEGMVEVLGPLRKWIGKDRELMSGGFAHVGARNIKELHEYGNRPMAFIAFTGAGIEQNNTRVMM